MSILSTPTIGNLNQKAPICWEQHNHTYDIWPNSTRELGWTPESQCQQIVILQANDWFGLELIGSLDVKLAGQHPMGHNGYVELTYGPGFP